MQPREADARAGELQFVDVRAHEEWERGHVRDSTHIPMGELPARLGELDAGRPVLAICRSGQRSARVTSWLLGQGYDAHNLDGGLKAWRADGLPLEDDQGAPGIVA